MMALVMGGGGFIGSRLVRALLREGRRVRMLDVSLGLPGGGGNDPNLQFFGVGEDELRGGMANPKLVREAVDNVEAVYHLALSWFGWKERPPLAYLFDVNIWGT